MRKLLIVLLSSLALAQSPQRTTYNNNGAGYAQGATIQVPNSAGSQAASFEYLFSNTPAAVSITIAGCMRGVNPNPGSVGTCDAAVDTYAGTSNSIRSPSFTKVYDTFLITVGTLSAGTTLTVNTTVVVSKAGTGSGGSGSGTVSPNNGSAGAVANYAAAGGSTTVAPNTGLTSPSTGELDLGSAGVGGSLKIFGSVSGSNTFSAAGNGTELDQTVATFKIGANGAYGTASGVMTLNPSTNLSLNPGSDVQVASTSNFAFVGGKGQHIKTQAAGNDIAGTCTAAAATTCTVTFTTAYTSAPACTVTDQTNITALKALPSTTTLVITTTAASSDVFSYICIGNPN